MANIVQSAVGTQRQFTKQPVATYQKSLKGINATTGIVNTGAGTRLYNALMGLGDAMQQYMAGEENRKKANVVRAQKIVNSMSEEDMKTLKGIDLLTKYGETQLADNPYAVAYIEQARGKYFSDQFNQQYALLQAKEPVKTAQEEAERYMSEKKKFLDENKDATYNMDGFLSGFWESNIQDVSNQMNQKVAEQSKSLMAVRDAESAVSFAKLAHDYSLAETQDPEALFKASQELCNSARIMQYPPEKRAALLHDYILNLAELTGSEDLVNKMGSLVIDTNDDGSDVTVADRVPLDDARKIANQTQLAKPNKYTLDIMLKLGDCKNNEEVDKLYSGLTKEAQNRMSSLFSKRKLEIQDEQKRAAQAKVAANQRQLASDQKMQMGRIALQRALAGKADFTSNVDADTAYAVAMEYLNSPEFKKIQGTAEGTRVFAKVMMWSPNRNMQKDYSGYFMQALISMTPDEMADSNTLNSITNCRSLWNNNPGRFAATFGDKLAAQMQVMQSLIDFSGDELGGYKLYCDGRNAMMKDPTRAKDCKEAAQAFVEDNLEGTSTSLELLDADHTDENKTATASLTDPILKDQVQNAFMFLKASGLTDEQANEAVNSSIYKNYVVYNGSILPIAVFAGMQKDDADDVITNGINAGDPIPNATEFMDAYIEEKRALTGYTGIWRWNPSISQMMFTVGDVTEYYTLDEFWNLSNQWHYDKQETESTEDNTDSSSEDTTSDDSEVNSVGTGRATYGGPKLKDKWGW